MDSVELLLDVTGEELLRSDWDILKQAGLPSQARHTAASNRAHITLLAAPRIPAQYDVALAALAGVLPLPIHTAGLVLFRTGRGQVLARLGVVSEALCGLHRAVHAALGDVPDVAGNCVPNRWVPHITLARGMNSGQVAQAVDLLPGDRGRLLLRSLRRWDSHEKTTTALGSATA
ncbi:2'-5' RNA ligase family protein [Arthrobacter tumbae]|uniref:2'-5' RNA ligase family protein n=1 Tax=Arthrobacter tumbae TaxID=163874 RepID=UPI00195C9D3D|nr:2'-5' RNA ligase family protein [Arthrobacter tumbae]MBM7781307.1 2'-5' RNA ligase [Arthrobacter tumbae]